MIEQQVNPRTRRRPWLLVAASVVAVVAVAALLYVLLGRQGSAPASTPVPPSPAIPTAIAAPSFEMKGSFDIFVDPSSALKDGQTCAGTGPAGESIGDGTIVRVFDQAGSQLATTDLGNGAFQRTPIGSACVFTLDVSGVPDGLPSYGVEVGTYGVHQVSSTQAHSNVFLSEGP